MLRTVLLNTNNSVFKMLQLFHILSTFTLCEGNTFSIYRRIGNWFVQHFYRVACNHNKAEDLRGFERVLSILFMATLYRRKMFY